MLQCSHWLSSGTATPSPAEYNVVMYDSSYLKEALMQEILHESHVPLRQLVYVELIQPAAGFSMTLPSTGQSTHCHWTQMSRLR